MASNDVVATFSSMNIHVWINALLGFHIIQVIMVMPARMIVLRLLMSGDVEVNPGPGMEEKLDSVCSHDHLNKIASTCCHDWKVVGKRLLTYQDVDDIEREGYSEQERRDKLFEVWRRKKGSGATYRVIINTFNEIKNQQAAEMVKNLLQSDLSQGMPQRAQTTPSSRASPSSGLPQRANSTPSSVALSPSEILACDINLYEEDAIGKGGQASVFKAFWKVKQIPVAVKKIGVLSNAAKREVETMMSVRHKNIVTFYGLYEITSQTFGLVLELADSSLNEYLKRSTPNFESSLNWAEQVVQGMHYLHFGAPEPIIHGDLKSPNVLVCSAGVLKIADFGSSKFKDGQQSSVTRVTIEWTAPELFNDEKHSMGSDVYAFGILLWEIMTHKVPYEGLTVLQVLSNVKENQRPSISSIHHESLREIIQTCWDLEPKKRPTFRTVQSLLEAAKSGENQSKSQHKVAEKKGVSLMRGGENQSKSQHKVAEKKGVSLMRGNMHLILWPLTLIISVISACFLLTPPTAGLKICFKEMEGSNQCQNSRDTCSSLSSDPNPLWTSPFRDDTDNRPGGCQYQWTLIGTPQHDKVYRVCFKESEGSSQCGKNNNSCSGWSNSPSWSAPFQDDTDNRSGGCVYQWRIEEQIISPSLNISACRVCFQETEKSEQCQLNRGPTCSGWSNSPAPTDTFQDDTDGRSGGCTYQWNLQCK